MHCVADSDLNAKKRVPKSVILKMIESGQYTVRTLNGTPITDFKKLFADYKGPQDSPPPPALPLDAQKAAEKSISRKRFSPRHTSLIKVNDTEYTISQLEHFGDAIVSVSARIICHELFKKSVFHYYKHSAAMITNENFRSSKEVKTAAQFEIILGDTYVRLGPQAAITRGVELLQTTKAYAEALTEVKTLDQQIHHEEVKLQKAADKRQRASDAVDRAPLQNTIGDAFPAT